jgi:hypothetical protein
VPQVAQKRAPAVTATPQARQNRVSRAAPHWAQKAPVPATPQAGQGEEVSTIPDSLSWWWGGDDAPNYSGPRENVIVSRITFPTFQVRDSRQVHRRAPFS